MLSEKTSEDVSIGVMHENIVPHKQEFIKVDASHLESNESVLQIFDFYEDIVAEGFPTESKYPQIQKDDLRDKFVDHEIMDAFLNISAAPNFFEDMCVTLNKKLNQHIMESKKWLSNDCEKNGFMETLRLELIQRQLTYIE